MPSQTRFQPRDEQQRHDTAQDESEQRSADEITVHKNEADLDIV